MCGLTPLHDPPREAQQRAFGADFHPEGFSRGLQVFTMGKFGENPTHGFLGNARICVDNLADRHARGERFQDKSHGNARAAYTRAATKVLRTGNNPVFHELSLRQSNT